MALPPPNEYRTLYDLPLLDEPKLSNKPSQASLQFTEYNLALYYVVISLNQDATTFRGSRYFLAILTRYYCICRQQHEALKKRLEKRPGLKLQLDPSGEVVTFDQLQEKITSQLDKVLTRIQSIALQLDKQYPNIPLVIPDLSQSAEPVANISVRECRMWCQLNTVDFRQRLQSARGTTELLPVMKEISDMILGDLKTVSPPGASKAEKEPKSGVSKADQEDKSGVFKVNKEDKRIVAPLVYFVCTGMGKEGNQLHNLVHVGCTRERLAMWQAFQMHRDKARDDLIGQETIEAWKTWHGHLRRLGTDQTTHTRNLRENLMRGNIEELPEWARGLPTTKLRACENHVGQSFMQLDWNTIDNTMGCCMICKTAISFEEVMGKDFENEARLINLMQRRHCPHSCAKVATSGVCDFITGTG